MGWVMFHGRITRIAICLVVLLLSAHCDDNNHVYTTKEIVSLWVNTVGPYHNPQETYTYYQLPFCKPDLGVDTKKRPSGIGEILEGNELRNSGFKVHFTENVDREDVCKMTLTAEQASKFETAVDEQYWYELFLDDLPMWGMVGEVLRDAKSGAMEKHVFQHRSLSISYNGNQIVEANLTSEDPVVIKPGAILDFTYSIKWRPTTKSFDDRFNRYLEYDFFEHQIHWFSVFNSFMMVVFLCGLVALILLRTLRNDFARYAKDEEIDVEGMHVIGEDSGWKQVHGDVFRAPSNLVTYAAMYGTGWQLLALILGVILFCMAGHWHGYIYEDRGELVSSFIVLFALSSSVAGYASGSYYRQFFTTPKAEQSSEWQKTMITTILLFPTMVVAVITLLNSIAVYYDTISAIPIGVIIKMAAIWIFVALPLSVAGTLFGRHWSSNSEPPCRVNSLPRPIPEAPWYSDPYLVVPLTGILPFGSIFIEMYFIFTAFWSYKFYYVYGFMLLVYCILSMVTICVTIVAVYFTLNAENYNWSWLAFNAAGSTSMYVYLYSLYYFFYKTEMTGLLQTAYFFGYMLLFCVGLYIMCGTIGSWGAGIFVRKIYRNVKID